MSNSSIWPIDRNLSLATTPWQNGPGSNGNQGVLFIPQIYKVGDSPSDCLMTYPRYFLGEKSYSSAEMQSVYSTTLADRGIFRVVVSKEFLSFVHDPIEYE